MKTMTKAIHLVQSFIQTTLRCAISLHPTSPEARDRTCSAASVLECHGSQTKARSTAMSPPRNGFQRPVGIEAVSSTHTVRQNGGQPSLASEASSKPRANRVLVPFAPDSELWPYSRSSAEESTQSDENGDCEIMELSFEETSVLSDPEAFDKALKSRRSAVNLRGYTNGKFARNIPTGTGVYLTAGSTSRGDEGSKMKLKGKKGKKERDARAQAEIERSWDIPPPSSVLERHTRTTLLC